MSSLTETAFYARKFIKYGSVGFLGLIVLWYAGTAAVDWWKATHPAPLPAPTADFGPLSPMSFPTTATNSARPQFVLQTPTGDVGTFPDRLKVYLIPGVHSGFLDADNATKIANQIGFSGKPTIVNPTLYRWTTNSPLPTTLEMDILTNHFRMKRQWQADPMLVTNKRFTSDQDVIDNAQSFLRQANLLPEDLVGKEHVDYLRVQGDQLIPAVSLSDADFVQVTFFRKPIEIINDKKEVTATYEFVTPDPAAGLVKVIVSGSDKTEKKIVDVDYQYSAIDYETSGEYGLKTGQQAWDELTSGQGFLASWNGTGTAVIRRVALGYYEAAGKQQYMLPVYIFTGDKGAVAYVPAVNNAYLTTQSAPTPTQ